MGFVTGFTGGVTLTLSIAYLTVLAHQRNREEQGRSLRAQSLAIRSVIDPIPQPLPPTRSEVAAAKRAEAIEIAKERWNEEIENAVRWVQSTDWEEVRQGIEGRITSLWHMAFGESIQDSAARAKNELHAGVNKAIFGAETAAGRIKAQTKKAFDQAKAEEEDFAAKVKDNVLQARLAAWREAQRAKNEVRQRAAEAEEAAKSALENGKEKATEIGDRAKSAVGLTGAGTGPGQVDLSAINPVHKALDQRFEKSGADKRTISEVLQQRYISLDKRDNTVLRGL